LRFNTRLPHTDAVKLASKRGIGIHLPRSGRPVSLRIGIGSERQPNGLGDATPPAPASAILIEYIETKRIFERHALAVVLAEPLSSGILIGEDFEVILVANLLACVDVDPDCHEKDSLTRSNAWCCDS